MHWPTDLMPSQNSARIEAAPLSLNLLVRDREHAVIILFLFTRNLFHTCSLIDFN